MKSQDCWRPYSVSWANKQGKCAGVNPLETYKSDFIEDTVDIKAVEFNRANRMFQVFKVILIFVFSGSPMSIGSETQ